VHELYAQPKATQQMLDDSSIDIESWLSRELIETFCDAEEKAFINGDGINKPQGLLNVLDAKYTQNTAQSKTIKSDDIISLYYSLDSKYSPNSKFIISRDCAQEIRTMKDQNGRYIWEPSLKKNGQETLLGCEVLVSAHMPKIKLDGSLIENTIAILFGDFHKAYQIIDREDIRVLRDPFTQKPYVKFYTTKRVGGMRNKADALCSLKISE
jgi:HK97 family phage major capsid protein